MQGYDELPATLETTSKLGPSSKHVGTTKTEDVAKASLDVVADGAGGLARDESNSESDELVE